MPIEWVGESLSSAYSPGETRPVDPLAKGPPHREEDSQDDLHHKSSRNPYKELAKQRPQRFERAVYAKEIMKTRAETVFEDDPLSKILNLILDHHALYLPVLQKNGQLSGIVSHFDVMRAVARENLPESTPASKLMRSKVLTATGNTTLHELSRVMVMERVDAVPILDSARKLVGLVTTAEMMQCIVHHSKLNVWI